MTGTAGPVRSGVTGGQDAPNRVGAVRSLEPATAGEKKPETFDFLGFTHVCARNGKTGRFTVRRKTARKRLAAKRKAIPQQWRQRRHEPTALTGQWLRSVVPGYFNDHAVPGNTRTLGT